MPSMHSPGACGCLAFCVDPKQSAQRATHGRYGLRLSVATDDGIKSEGNGMVVVCTDRAGRAAPAMMPNPARPTAPALGADQHHGPGYLTVDMDSKAM